MKAKIVYGCPCSGKSTYTREHAGADDVIYDYDALVLAMTTREKLLVDRHAAHFLILGLRKAIVDSAKEERINCVWLQCRWPTETIKEILADVDTEEIFVKATKEECYERLEADDKRPDKDEWRKVIDDWFLEHGERKDDHMNNKFWNFVENDAGERILRLEGPIDSDAFWGDETTPSAFREELEAGEGDITVWINSPGGDVFAAAEIYTMLCDYKGKVTVKIDAIAASAASVVAMAGDKVLMSPVGMLFIHDPMTMVMGNVEDMEKAITTLNAIKESIIEAYARKTGLSRNKIAQLMSEETWLPAKRALNLGFIDGILFSKEGEEHEEIENSWQSYSSKVMDRTILNRIIGTKHCDPITNAAPAEAANKSAVLDDAVADTTMETPAEASALPEAPTAEATTAMEAPATAEADTVSEAPAEPAEAHTTTEVPEVSEATPTVTDAQPVIGMDGKTKDGSMPYILLSKQLEFLGR